MRRFLPAAILVAAAAALALPLRNLSGNYWREEDHSKSIKFSHVFHVKEQTIACLDCHTKVAASARSSDTLTGNHESCKPCHEEQVSNTCAFCHTTPEKIVPVRHPARELIFSHELHATKHEIKCETCHAGVDSVVYATNENMPSMETCTSCHTEKKVSTRCETCHTDFATLVPGDHAATDFKKDHRRLTRLGMMDVSCSKCHSENFCQDCHTGTELHGFTGARDLMADPSPRTSTKDSPKQLKLQEVHGLNYRFTHGIEAKSKALDCASCHEQQTFCVRCHEAGGNINQQKFKPESHNVSGFTTIGKGSGGGRHAELGRRDLESCMSCHDVQGSDPTCTMCHTENGSVR
jgi:cytochrome c7-like protein